MSLRTADLCQKMKEALYSEKAKNQIQILASPDISLSEKLLKALEPLNPN
jgi:hypothetical protein